MFKLLMTYSARRWLHTTTRRLGSMSSSVEVPLWFPYTRSFLYVPAESKKKLAKVPELLKKSDLVVLDLEDGVAQTSKDDARKNVVQFLREFSAGKELVERDPTVPFRLAVRVNSTAAGDDLLEKDIVALAEMSEMHPHALPATIVLPKVDTVDDYKSFVDVCKRHKLFFQQYDRGNLDVSKDSKNEAKPDKKEEKDEKESSSEDSASPLAPELVRRPFNVVLFCESPIGLLNLVDVCRHAVGQRSIASLWPRAVVFGSDDFVSQLGCNRSDDGKELVYARQHLVCAAKAFSLQAIDMVHLDLSDDGMSKTLQLLSLDSVSMGFTGRQVIHPGQLMAVNDSYTPSKARLEWATRLVETFADHQKSGTGAFVFEGKMIDMPLLRQAEAVLTVNQQLENMKKWMDDAKSKETPTEK